MTPGSKKMENNRDATVEKAGRYERRKCKELECIKKLDTLQKSDPGDYLHCQVRGCCEIYWWEDNGQICDVCGTNFCESCSYDGHDLPDGYVCINCFNDKGYIECQNPMCTYIIDPKYVIRCCECKKAFCEDCYVHGDREDDENDQSIFTCEKCFADEKRTRWINYRRKGFDK